MNSETIQRLNDVFVESIGAVVVVVLVFLFYRVLIHVLGSLEERGKLEAITCRYARRGIRWAAVVIAVLLSLQVFGVLKTTWATFTALLSLIAIGFVAVWSVLSNSLCSVMLMVAQPFQVGDTIEIRPLGFRGKVVNFSFMYTTLLSDGGGHLFIPNNLFFQNAIERHAGATQIPLDAQLRREEDAE